MWSYTGYGFFRIWPWTSLGYMLAIIVFLLPFLLILFYYLLFLCGLPASFPHLQARAPQARRDGPRIQPTSSGEVVCRWDLFCSWPTGLAARRAGDRLILDRSACWSTWKRWDIWRRHRFWLVGAWRRVPRLGMGHTKKVS